MHVEYINNGQGFCVTRSIHGRRRPMLGVEKRLRVRGSSYTGVLGTVMCLPCTGKAPSPPAHGQARDGHDRKPHPPH